MDPELKQEFTSYWEQYFPGQSLPITFEYASDPRSLEKKQTQINHRCLICDLGKVRNGHPLAFDADSVSCRGGKRYCGFETEMFPDFRYFLSCGIPGRMDGERYKKSPEVVDEWQAQISLFPAPGKYLIFQRWDTLTEKDNPHVVIFFARPEVISGLFTLANYDRADPHGVIVPMGAGCSSIIHYPWLEEQSEDPRAVLGMMDPSARPCVPVDILTFAVPMKKMTQMIRDMDESFLTTPTWKKVQAKIVLSQKQNQG